MMLQQARVRVHVLDFAVDRTERVQHEHEMENGKRPIGRKMARTLAKVLKIDYRYLL